MSHNPLWQPSVCFNVTRNMYYTRVLPEEYEGMGSCGGSEDDASCTPVDNV